MDVIPNPGFGTDNLRLKDEYFDVMKEVRNSIDRVVADGLELPEGTK